MTLQLEKSEAVFARGQNHIPGGVNSPVRALKAVGGTPFLAASARGPWVTDLDGNRYVDYILSYGPMILGHGHPAVTKAVQDAAERGLSYRSSHSWRSGYRGEAVFGIAFDGSGSPGEFGNGGHHERNPRCPGIHGSGNPDQVYRVLSRSCGLLACQKRFGWGDIRGTG